MDTEIPLGSLGELLLLQAAILHLSIHSLCVLVGENSIDLLKRKNTNYTAHVI